MRTLAAAAMLSLLSYSSITHAQVFSADFETGDLSQWNGSLNARNITVEASPVFEGAYAGKITLTNDAVWPNNGLKRVEVRHFPNNARTAEGADTYFAWSFYLPATLPTDPSQQIGYWESNGSYQQMMAFQVEGERIRFDTRRPQNTTQWDQDGAATAGVWHRIAMHITWSKNANDGRVDVWFDGQQVVADAIAQTLADDNPHFTQLGLLRGAIEFTDSPVIMIDHALEGDSLAEVAFDAQANGGGSGSGGNGTGGAGAGTGGGGFGGDGFGGDGTGGAATGAHSSAGGADATPPDDSGCAISRGIHAASGAPGDASKGSPTGSIPWIVLALFGVLVGRRRS